MESAMANESAAASAPAQASPTAALFQKAHAKIVTLQRIDEQLTSLVDQRKKLQDELREVQSQINDEFNRVINDAQESHPRLAEQATGKSRRANGETLRLEVAQAG
jgi:predicted  nucleic acid-binding Zn-ribbon protein